MPASLPVPERLTWAVAQLPAGTGDAVLEIGCGGGHALALLLARHPRAAFTGIDRSPGQVARACARNAAAVAAGRLRVHALDLHDAADVLGDGAFAHVLAVNVNAFWTTPTTSVASLTRLLAPGGRAYLAYEPPGASGIGALQAALPTALAAHGLAVVDVRTTRFRATQGLCVIAARGAGDRRASA